MELTLGERILLLRRSKKIPGRTIKELTEISPGNLSDIETGKVLPSANAIISLATALECTTDYILTVKNRISELFITDDEKKLLNYFNELSEDNKKELLLIAEMKFNLEKNKKNIKKS